MATTERRLMTVDELLSLPDDGMRHELVRGELRTMTPAGWEHGEITSVVDTSLRTHVTTHGLGRVGAGDIGFWITRNPDTLRAPDLAFISAARLPRSQRMPGFSDMPPDLVIEIVSPTDRYTDVAEKVAGWLEYGVRMVALIDPRRRLVSVQCPGKPLRELREDAVLEGQDVVPGWRLPIRDIFSVVPEE